MPCDHSHMTPPIICVYLSSGGMLRDEEEPLRSQVHNGCLSFTAVLHGPTEGQTGKRCNHIVNMHTFGQRGWTTHYTATTLDRSYQFRTVFCSGAGGCRADSWDSSNALRAASWDCLRSNCSSLSLIKFESVNSCCSFRQLSLTWHMASLLCDPSSGLCVCVEVLSSQTPAGRSGGSRSAPIVRSLHWLITLLISALTR